MMIITKLDFYKTIAEKENISQDIIKKIFRSAENIMFHELSSVSDGEINKVHIMDGLSVESKIVNKKERNLPNGIKVENEPTVKITPKVTRWYKEKINQNR